MYSCNGCKTTMEQEVGHGGCEDQPNALARGAVRVDTGAGARAEAERKQDGDRVDGEGA